MADTVTDVYGFTLPEVGGSEDTWGNKLNTNWADVETLLISGFTDGTASNIGNLRAANFPDPINGAHTVTGSWDFTIDGTSGIRIPDPADVSRFVLTSPSLGSLLMGNPNMTSQTFTGQWTFNSNMDVSGVARFVSAVRIENPGNLQLLDATDTWRVYLSETDGAVSFGNTLMASQTLIGQWATTGSFSIAGALSLGSNLTLPADGFILFPNTDDSIRKSGSAFTFFSSGSLAARIEPQGTGVPQTTSVVTREKGDARYAQTAAPSFTGGITVSGGMVIAGNITQSAGSIVMPAIGNLMFGSSNTRLSVETPDGVFLFWQAGALVGRVEPQGTGMPSTVSIITREKGDARYAPQASPSFTGDVTTSGHLVLPTTGSVQFGSSANRIQNTAAGGPISITLASTIAARFDPAGITAPATTTVITREKGDNRYAPIASSIRYKDGLEPAELPIAGFMDLSPYWWVWGGELDDHNPRRGKSGFGLVAEEVGEVFPEAVIVGGNGKIEGLDPLPLIGALFAEIKALKARLSSLEERQTNG